MNNRIKFIPSAQAPRNEFLQKLGLFHTKGKNMIVVDDRERPSGIYDTGHLRSLLKLKDLTSAITLLMIPFLSNEKLQPILRSADLKGTAWILNHLHNYNDNKYSEQPFCSHDFRTKRGIASLQERMLTQLYRVGPRLAKTLLEKFGSVGGILKAKEEELLAVKGVGKMLIYEIKIIRGEKD